MERAGDRFAFEFFRLRTIRDEILAYWDSRTDADGHRMWASDTRRAWNSTVQAWDLVCKSEDLDSAEGMLHAAASAVGQAASSLVIDDRSKELASQMRAAFDVISKELWTELRRRHPARGEPPATSVLRVNDEELDILCSVCGRVAARFFTGPALTRAPDADAATARDHLIYEGCTQTSELPLEQAATLFPMLERGDLAAVHAYLPGICRTVAGLDVWCPACSRAYCRTDYGVRDEWDEGFFDASYGRCPNGHERMLRD